MEEKKKSSRKDRIKNIAIIFLVIMLILTFFSNTIMNYSLPQVATERVMSNTITAKVRGSGTVSASDPYNVVIEQSRKIKSVKVKNGDVVEKDAVLFELEDAESTELTEARKALEDLMDSYNKTIVSADSSSALVSQVENGTASSAKAVLTKIDSYNKQIDSLNNSINSYNKRIAEIESRLSSIGEPSVDTSGEQKKVTEATTRLANAEADVEAKKSILTAAQNTLTSVYGAVKTAEDEEAAAKKAMDDAQAVYEAALVRYAELKAEAETTPAATEAASAAAESAAAESSAPETTAAEGPTPQEIAEDYRNNTLIPAETAANDAKSAYEAAQTHTVEVKAANEEAVKKAQNDVTAATNNYNSAENNRQKAEEALNQAKADLEKKQNSSPDTSERDQLNEEKASLSLKVSEATQTLADVQKDLQDLLTSYGVQSELTSMLEDIAEQKQKIADLEAQSIGTVITAPVAGTVSGISYVAGDTANAGDTLAQVISSEKGFTLSFSVTADQAKKISVGDVAEIQNSWYYNDVAAVVAGFKTDVNNRQNKLVVFSVTGDVTNGQSMTLSVGSKSATYDLVVPNSAIREDNNGKFVLIVESKPSPLGNRYVATRVDVEVIASDDNYSAIKGGLYGYEYVITTSTQPVEAGKYVRLAD